MVTENFTNSVHTQRLLTDVKCSFAALMGSWYKSHKKKAQKERWQDVEDEASQFTHK